MRKMRLRVVHVWPRSQKPKCQGEVPPYQYQVPSFGSQEEEHTDINAFNGKCARWGQQAMGKSNGKGN